jgi:hypothetical protein
MGKAKGMIYFILVFLVITGVSSQLGAVDYPGITVFLDMSFADYITQHYLAFFYDFRKVDEGIFYIFIICCAFPMFNMKKYILQSVIVFLILSPGICYLLNYYLAVHWDFRNTQLNNMAYWIAFVYGASVVQMLWDYQFKQIMPLAIGLMGLEMVLVAMLGDKIETPVFIFGHLWIVIGFVYALTLRLIYGKVFCDWNHYYKNND